MRLVLWTNLFFLFFADVLNPNSKRQAVALEFFRQGGRKDRLNIELILKKKPIFERNMLPTKILMKEFKPM